MMNFNSRASSDPAFRIEKVATIGRPVAPDTRDRILEIDGADGAFDFGSDLSSGTIPVRLYLRTKTPEEERESIRAIVDWLSPRIVRPLIFSDEPGKQYYARRTGNIRASGAVTRRFL